MQEFWKTSEYEFWLHENNSGLWFAKLKVRSARFDYWTELVIRNRPFKTRRAAASFVNTYLAGFALRHNIQSWNYA